MNKSSTRNSNGLAITVKCLVSTETATANEGSKAARAELSP
jgi:hypothetical protein